MGNVTLKFKHQPFQQEAAQSVVNCFKGQPSMNNPLNPGNFPIQLSGSAVLENIQSVQRTNNLPVSFALDGQYNLSIEMETGTGKTYTYIKTMYELNRAYGWKKFIVVVPSVAIREGVFKSFQMTEDHFFNQYNRSIRYFIYDSGQLAQIKDFATDPNMHCMIINSQAFNVHDKGLRIIHSTPDQFNSDSPMRAIAATHPILIIDEPQTVEGDQTKKALQAFDAPIVLRYSATLKKDFNKIYELNPVDAYEKKLVKKIAVKGITTHGRTGTQGYIYLKEITLSKRKPPLAAVHFEVKQSGGIKLITRKLRVGDNLFELSNRLEAYRGYVVSDINGSNQTLTFTNGHSIKLGSSIGSSLVKALRQIQIRETIQSHLERQEALFKRGIKVLSLFFIDEVAKYRDYGRNGHRNGEYAQMFEQEYQEAVQAFNYPGNDPDFLVYLNHKVSNIHEGYFSQDRFNRLINTKIPGRKRDQEEDYQNVNDQKAFDLIMKDKERLLSLDEPVRFLFSHSALKEGWDNPNVFQICTLKHSDSGIGKRQEIGRGMRLCVNQDGDRMDAAVLGNEVHQVNVLTVITNESYQDFAQSLQKEIFSAVDPGQYRCDPVFFSSIELKKAGEPAFSLDYDQASELHHWLFLNGYIDECNYLTEDFYYDLLDDCVVLPYLLAGYEREFLKEMEKAYKRQTVATCDNALENSVIVAGTNGRFKHGAFQALWNIIRQKTIYRVQFNSQDLITRSIQAINDQLKVTTPSFQISSGAFSSFNPTSSSGSLSPSTVTRAVAPSLPSHARYDLIGEIARQTSLKRGTVVAILKGMDPSQFDLFKVNPNEFIMNCSSLINQVKWELMKATISYGTTTVMYSDQIFSQSIRKGFLGQNAVKTKKQVYDYLIYDSSVEHRFALDLEASDKVIVYAKLPPGFLIPTPVGNYNPDWAIVMKGEKGQWLYLVVETKSTKEERARRGTENDKIDCAVKHFAALNHRKKTTRVTYHVVDSFETLLNEL